MFKYSGIGDMFLYWCQTWATQLRVITISCRRKMSTYCQQCQPLLTAIVSYHGACPWLLQWDFNNECAGIMYSGLSEDFTTPSCQSSVIVIPECLWTPLVRQHPHNYVMVSRFACKFGWSCVLYCCQIVWIMHYNDVFRLVPVQDFVTKVDNANGFLHYV